MVGKKKWFIVEIKGSFKAPFKQYSAVTPVAPHWFLGIRSFGGESFMDNMLNHYTALAHHRYDKLIMNISTKRLCA